MGEADAMLSQFIRLMDSDDTLQESAEHEEMSD